MFYLIHFAKIAIRFPFKILSWFVLTLAYIVLSSNPHLPLTIMSEYNKQDAEPAYFHALIDGEQNHSRLSRNLLELPQVEKVDLLNQEEIIDQVNMALSGIKHDLPEGLLALNYNGLKVTFAQDVKESSQDLVRDYLTRLGGSQNVTLGPIIKSVAKSTDEKTWSHTIVYFSLAVLIVFWAYLTYVFTKLIHRECYLIQEFQRRNFVANKVYAIAIGLVMLMSAVILIQLGQMTLGAAFAALLLMPPFLLLKRRYQW